MFNKQVVTPFEPADHQHSQCLKSAISRAEDNCASSGVRLTPLRRRVLELVWKSHEPVKAYDILETLQFEKKRAAPPTVYRALEFLQQQGFVHKLESLNAYIGCGAPGHNNTSQFLICHKCGVVAELDDSEIGDLISSKADDLGFTPKQLTIEIKGLCNHCRPA
jgi:Fur family transcriptional regulator, zinc uptake regulator